MKTNNCLLINSYKMTSSDNKTCLYVNICLDSEDITSITGIGKVINKEEEIIVNSNLIGDARVFWVEGPRGIRVSLTGYPFYFGIPPAGFYVPPNMKIDMILNDKWESCKSHGSFGYYHDDKWHYVDEAKIERLSTEIIDYGKN